MAHFARIEGNTVQQVIVIANDDCGGGDFPASEAAGQAFIANTLKLAGEWKQTSYSGSFRAKYAGIGDRYDAELDEFVTPAVEPTE
jgi:hypothetical protein